VQHGVTKLQHKFRKTFKTRQLPNGTYFIIARHVFSQKCHLLDFCTGLIDLGSGNGTYSLHRNKLRHIEDLKQFHIKLYWSDLYEHFAERCIFGQGSHH